MAQRVTDHGDTKKYRTEIPNIVLTLGLSPYELTLYVHLKRTAGADGVCWKSTATLARETNMSSGMVSKAKLTLQQRRPELKKPLITVAEEINKKGGKPNHAITITDIWPQNMAKFSSSQDEVAALPSSPDERASSYSEVASSPHERTSSPHEIRKEPVKKELNEEGTQEETKQRVNRADTRGTRLPDDFCLNSEMREWAALNTPHVDLNLGLAEFVDYWRGVPGQRGRKLDWLGTWRNRMRELEARAPRNGHGGATSKVAASLDAGRSWVAKKEAEIEQARNRA